MGMVDKYLVKPVSGKIGDVLLDIVGFIWICEGSKLPKRLACELCQSSITVLGCEFWGIPKP